MLRTIHATEHSTEYSAKHTAERRRLRSGFSRRSFFSVGFLLATVESRGIAAVKGRGLRSISRRTFSVAIGFLLATVESRGIAAVKGRGLRSFSRGILRGSFAVLLRTIHSAEHSAEHFADFAISLFAVEVSVFHFLHVVVIHDFYSSKIFLFLFFSETRLNFYVRIYKSFVLEKA